MMELPAHTHALSVDVEDWNNVALLARSGKIAPPTDAVVRNTERMLELFQAHGAGATWFILGEVAEAYPDLVRKLVAAGQEIGVHGYHHHNVFDLRQEEFRAYVQRAKAVIEQLSGQPVLGYRATSFSITRKVWWAFDVLAELGFSYDSSVFPIRGRRYGIPDAPLQPYALTTKSGVLTEIPLTVLELGRWRLPCCGGGYLRHFPLAFTRFAIKRVIAHRRAAVVYLHPYELDPTIDHSFFRQHWGCDLPRAPWVYLQYRQRRRTVSKLDWLLRTYRFAPMTKVFQIPLPPPGTGTEAAAGKL